MTERLLIGAAVAVLALGLLALGVEMLVIIYFVLRAAL